MFFGGCGHVYGVCGTLTAALMRSTDRLPIIAADIASNDGGGFFRFWPSLEHHCFVHPCERCWMQAL